MSDMTPSEAKAANSSLGELLTEVTRDLSTLMRQEIALARAEITQSAKKAGIPYGRVLERIITIGLQWQPTRMAFTPEG